jgi:hypothetical protein
MAIQRASSGRTLATGIGVIAVVGVATLLAILFRGGGGSGDGGSGAGAGRGTGPGTSPTTQVSLPAAPQRPLKVVIQESDYLVNGQPVDLVTLTELAGKVPPGSGPAVLVERSPSSRAKAENDLRDALNKKGITHASD